MKTLYLNDEAMAAIRSMAESAFKQTAVRMPNGVWAVPVDEDVAVCLENVRWPFESDSHAIVRMVAFAKSGGKAQ